VELQPGDPAVDAQPASAPAVPASAGQPVQADASISAPLARPGEESIQDPIDETFAPITLAEATTLSLSPPQRTAIKLLTSGHTLVDAATAAGVSRMTLYRWLKGDAAFSAAFNAWQKDVLDTARGRILALSDLAVTTVARSMSRGDAKTALKILQSVGALDRPKPGSTDPEEIERQQRLEWKKSKTAARKAESDALLDDLSTI
jgi:hypothetical protein